MNIKNDAHPIHEDPQSLRALLNSLPGMAYRSRPDRARRLEFASPGCLLLTGYSPSDLTQGHSLGFEQIIHPADRALVWNQIEAAVRERKSFDFSYRILTEPGREKWVRDMGHCVISPTGELQALEGFLVDITDRKETEGRLKRQIERFEALRKIDIAITASVDQRVTFDILLDQVTTHLAVDAADVLIFNPASRLLEYFSGRGFRTSALQHTRLRLGESHAGTAALKRETIHIPDLAYSPGELNRAAHLSEEGFVTYFCVPLIAKGMVKGILEIFHRSLLNPDPEWLDFLEALAGQAAITIDNAALFNELQRSNMELSMAYDATLEGWSRALAIREKQTEAHSQASVDLTLRLVQAMRVTSTDALHIRRGALLHDIGKMAIPDNILLKAGPLTQEEWEIMRQHPVHAYKLLSPIADLRPALDIPYCHHEKWDGSGYPRGLKGEQIPVTARIFAVADVFNALLEDRPYRPAWTKEQAFDYIREQSGKHFDPQVVQTFFQVMEGPEKPAIGYLH